MGRQELKIAKDINLDVAAITATALETEGMMMRESIAIWHAVLQTQHATWEWNGLAGGPYLEIGTYKGKSASILAHYSRSYGNGFEIVDPVVAGETKEMLNEINEDVKFNEIRSEYLQVSDCYRRLFRSCSFIHIDGMHKFSAVTEDLKNAEQLLGDFGVICVDDFYTNFYPQVAAAVYRYLYSGDSDLSLFLIGFNKAYLCRNEAKRYFHTCVRDDFRDRLWSLGFDLALLKTDRHDLFDVYALAYVEPELAGEPHP